MSNWFRTYGFADVLDELLVGAYPLDEDDVAMLEWLGVRRVLNLVSDAEYRSGEHEAVAAALAAAGIEEQRIIFTDYGELPPAELEQAVVTLEGWLDGGLRSYVHCRAGWQRSAAVAAGVVAIRNGLEIGEALEYVKRRKPSADPLPHQQEDLRGWWSARTASADEPETSTPHEAGTGGEE
ncbi:MAG: protein-tyrosine phosphatase family protein [Solirubrobacteraceae bacterium]